MNINFFFRSPVFPVILDIGMGATCSETPSDLESYLVEHGSADTTHRTLIDSSYEGFSIIPAKLYVSPLTLKKKYTKKELLQFCGINDPALSQKRLDAYSKEDIFRLIVKVSQKNG